MNISLYKSGPKYRSYLYKYGRYFLHLAAKLQPHQNTIIAITLTNTVAAK